jgi:maleate isomerase
MQSKLEKRAEARIAMLTPSSNTVLEPFTGVMTLPLFPDVSVHYARFRVTRIGLDLASNDQFALEPILQAAELLADAKPDIIAWNGTSASWLGFDTDERLCHEISARTGIAATSAVLSFNRILMERGIKRLGLVTPYTVDVQKRIIANYAAVGVETVSERHAGLSNNFSFAEVPERQISAMCEDVARANPEAIVIMCTNMRGPLIVPDLETRLGIPVLDSIAFTLWGCLRQCHVPMAPLRQFGSLFTDPLITEQAS